MPKYWYPYLEDYRNDFVLGCLTALRFSDFPTLDENDVRGDMLYKKQEKSDSYKKGNKDVIEVKPKYAWITSHTHRRSFCTNEFLAGTPVELIMKISGHKSVKDFYKYIRITHS